ncbi:MAG: PqiC family protein [Janthinobacterium lividum]
MKRVRSFPQALRHLAHRLAIPGALVAGLSVLVAGCGTSPPSRFYTLTGPVDAPGATLATSAAQSTPATPAWAATATPLLIELAPTIVPQQVARPQMVVGVGPDQVELKEQERWAAPLGDEIGSALSADLTQQLGAIDVYSTPRADAVPVYRISVNVQRFESLPGSRATIEAVWSVRRVPGDQALTCRSVASEAVGPGYAALVGGHRRALAHVAADISFGVGAVRDAASRLPPASPQATTASGTHSVTAAGATTDYASAPRIACPISAASAS